jgi:hypothetical protein
MNHRGMPFSNESFTSSPPTIFAKKRPIYNNKEKEESIAPSNNLDVLSSRQKMLEDSYAGDTAYNSKSKNKNKSNSKRAIHFHDTASILWIESVEDMSDEEIDACYYSSRDYLGFRDRERNMSRHFSNWGIVQQSRLEEFLGVESRLQRYHRRQRNKNAVFAVILEQELGQELGQEKEHDNVRDADSLVEVEDDDVIIARIYQQYTGESTRLALGRGATNATLVNTTSPSSSSSCSSPFVLKERGIKEKEAASVPRRFLLPWEIPGPSQNKTTRSRPADLVRYTSCTHPILPHHYLEMSSWDQPQEPKDFQYEHRCELQERETNNGRRRQQAPVQQKIIRSQEYDQVLPQGQCQYLPRQWPMYCDIVPPMSAPRLLTWNVY